MSLHRNGCAVVVPVPVPARRFAPSHRWRDTSLHRNGCAVVVPVPARRFAPSHRRSNTSLHTHGGVVVSAARDRCGMIAA
jgi:hypothetical protein